MAFQPGTSTSSSSSAGKPSLTQHASGQGQAAAAIPGHSHDGFGTMEVLLVRSQEQGLCQVLSVLRRKVGGLLCRPAGTNAVPASTEPWNDGRVVPAYSVCETKFAGQKRAFSLSIKGQGNKGKGAGKGTKGPKKKGPKGGNGFKGPPAADQDHNALPEVKPWQPPPLPTVAAAAAANKTQTETMEDLGRSDARNSIAYNGNGHPRQGGDGFWQTHDQKPAPPVEATGIGQGPDFAAPPGKVAPSSLLGDLHLRVFGSARERRCGPRTPHDTIVRARATGARESTCRPESHPGPQPGRGEPGGRVRGNGRVARK